MEFKNTNNLVTLLEHKALIQSDRKAYVFLGVGKNSTESLTYQHLAEKAKVIASYLQSKFNLGDRAILLYPSGLEFMSVFFGCLYAGIIAIPLPPPDMFNKKANLSRLKTVIEDARPTLVLTTSKLLSSLEEVSSQFAKITWLSTENINSTVATPWQQPLLSPDTTAYLQYTSGSTGKPKGVMITHNNLLKYFPKIFSRLEYNSETKVAMWQPHFHDAGLVGRLSPLYFGAVCYIISPFSFIKRPIHWLQSISKYQITNSGGPNFAYDYCLRQVTPEELNRLDLSSWSVATNGAEPVNQETLANFAKTFASCGFNGNAFSPGYGLAEATLAVTCVKKLASPTLCRLSPESLAQNKVIETSEPSGKVIVGCGYPLEDTKVIIVNPKTLTQSSPDEVGEIWVKSECVANGYWHKLEATKETFQAYLADTNEGPFLRTGDLGFLKEGQLFITGRLKDVIIIRGQNYYPQDLEWTVEKCHPQLRPNASAAFGIEVQGVEQMVIVAELEGKTSNNKKTAEIIAQIREKVAQEHELSLYAVVLIKQGTIPKTSSGKIQRYTCRQQYINNDLSIISYCQFQQAKSPTNAPRNQTEMKLAQIWQAVLGREKVGINDNFFALGGNSLLATQVVSRIEDSFKVEFPLHYLFEFPTIEELGVIIEQSGQETQHSSIPMVSRKQELPLSFAQERLWFINELEGNSPVYNIAQIFQIEGPLNCQALEKAIAHLFQRHESLRTNFGNQNGNPVQIIHPQVDFALPIINLEDFSREEEIEKLIEQEKSRCFDLEKDTLIRFRLFKISCDRHILIISMHHIITDGWSMGILTKELSHLYKAYSQNQPVNLPDLGRQYLDFAVWQRQWFTGEVLEKQLQYWKKQLEGIPPLIDLPLDKPRPLLQTFVGAQETFKLNASMTKRLKALAQDNGITLYIVLLTAFSVLLYRYTHQSDLVIGSAIANRNRKEIEGLVGFFANTLALRVKFLENPTFKELLGRLKQIAFEAYEHQDLPFEKLVEQLNPDRNLGHHPIFQVMFVFQNTPDTNFKLEGLEINSIQGITNTAKFDLSLLIRETEEELNCVWEYNRDLFNSDTITRMSEHFQTLLAGIVKNSQEKISNLPLLTEPEKQKILIDWNNTKVDYPQDKCIHQLFEEQVEKTPNAIAVTFEEQQLTYQELNEKANQLAHYLRKLGVQPETTVGIYLERSLEMIVAILGILKASGAYVPFDSLSPPKRITKILKSANSNILLTQENLATQFHHEEILLISVDRQSEEIAKFHEYNLSCNTKSHQLAYVIFTSGSTGEAKGVAIAHRSAINLLTALKQSIYKDESHSQQRVSLNGSLAFDTSVKQIIQLLHGKSLDIIPDQMRFEPESLLSYLTKRQFDVFDCTPAQLKLLIDAGLLENPRAPKYILVGGEPIDKSLWLSLSQAKYSQFYNLYGPTECTVDVTVSKIDKTITKPIIGRAIANTQTYILCQNLQPVPIGIPGELCIAGDGLAKFYLNARELTAAKFINNPFGQGRLYKTGDQAKYLPDGNIEFLGRIDHQVKIRGFRIELGEIEVNLNKHPSLKENMVIVRENQQGEKYLLAYVVAHKEKPEVKELRNFLREKLPEYMIPTAFVFLDSFPLTANGKIDRRALPEVDWQTNREDEFRAPRNETEMKLATIWQEVLGIEQVGISDNFFALGGHSLLATQVISRISNSFGVELPLRSLFEFSTIGELSDHFTNSYLTKSRISLWENQNRKRGEI